MVAALAEASAMPRLPHSMADSGGSPGVDIKVPTMAVNTMSATTRGLVNARYRRQCACGNAYPEDVAKLLTAPSAAHARSDQPMIECQRRQQQQGGPAIVRGGQPQRETLHDHRDADRQLQPQGREHRD